MRIASTLTPSLALLLSCLAACNGSDPPADDTTGTDSTGAATETPTTGTPTGSESGDPELCGNGSVDPGEDCDGDAPITSTCAELDDAFTGGTLTCAASCKFDTSACEVDQTMSLVVLNEVSSQDVLEGPYADMGDAIEVFNAGGEEADLTGWKLSDDPLFPIDKTYVFPPGTTLAPGGYLVLVAYDDVSMEGQLPFGISATNEETLTLVDAGDGPVDELIVDGLDAVISYCRLPDGTGAWQKCDQTFGGANATATIICGDGKLEAPEECDGAELDGQTCVGLGIGFSGGTLACNELCKLDASMCTADSEVVINEVESTEDRIELYNSGDQMVDLEGWILTDDNVDQDYNPMLDDEKLTFSAGSMLAPGEFLVVAKGLLDGQHPFGISDSGDTITLLLPSAEAVDQVNFGPGEAAISYCRLPDGPGGEWTPDCLPTFGLANEAP